MRDRVLLCLIVILFSFSCARKTDPFHDGTLIEVSIDKTHRVCCDSLDCVLLGSSNVFSTIDDVLFKDSIVIVKTNNAIYSFDINSGHFRTQMSECGRGPGEYIQAWDIGLMRENMFIYDIDGRNCLIYDMNGTYINTLQLPVESTNAPFQSLIPIRDGGFIGKRVFGVAGTPELSLYDAKLNYITDIGDNKVTSGIKLWRQFFSGADNDILYVRYFSDVIWSIENGDITAKYNVSFGNKTFVEYDDMADEYECIDYLEKHKKRVAYGVCNVYESSKYLAFQFFFNDEQFMSVYDKEEKSTEVYNFISTNGSVSQLYFTDGSIYVFMDTLDNKEYLYRFDIQS